MAIVFQGADGTHAIKRHHRGQLFDAVPADLMRAGYVPHALVLPVLDDLLVLHRERAESMNALRQLVSLDDELNRNRVRPDHVHVRAIAWQLARTILARDDVANRRAWPGPRKERTNAVIRRLAVPTRIVHRPHG